MTWLNCTLEEYTVPFTIMRPNCTSDGNVCWKNCTAVPQTKMMPQMGCEVKVRSIEIKSRINKAILIRSENNKKYQ